MVANPEFTFKITKKALEQIYKDKLIPQLIKRDETIALLIQELDNFILEQRGYPMEKGLLCAIQRHIKRMNDLLREYTTGSAVPGSDQDTSGTSVLREEEPE